MNNINILINCDYNIENDINILYFKLKILKNRKDHGIQSGLFKIISSRYIEPSSITHLDLIVMGKCSASDLKKYNNYMEKLISGGYLYVIPESSKTIQQLIPLLNGTPKLNQTDFTRVFHPNINQDYIIHNIDISQDIKEYHELEKNLIELHLVSDDLELVKNSLIFLFPNINSEIFELLIRNAQWITILDYILLRIIQYTSLFEICREFELINKTIGHFYTMIQSKPDAELAVIDRFLISIKKNLQILNSKILSKNDPKLTRPLKLSLTDSGLTRDLKLSENDPALARGLRLSLTNARTESVYDQEVVKQSEIVQALETLNRHQTELKRAPFVNSDTIFHSNLGKIEKLEKELLQSRKIVEAANKE